MYTNNKKAIIEIWAENIKDDYDNHRLLKEETLKIQTNSNSDRRCRDI